MRLTETMRDKIAKDFSLATMPDLKVPGDSEVAALVLASIPSDVLRLWDDKKYAQYIKVENGVKVRLTPGDVNRSWWGDGVWDIALREALPIAKGSGYHYLEYSDATAGIAARYTAYKNRLEERKELRNRILTALKAFTTTKQVHEALPELSPYVPEDASTALLPIQNYERLRADLQALASAARQKE